MAKTGIVNFVGRDQNSERVTKNLPNVNPAYLPPLDTDSTITIAEAQASIRAATIALNGLTTNTMLSIGLTTKEDITTAG